MKKYINKLKSVLVWLDSTISWLKRVKDSTIVLLWSKWSASLIWLASTVSRLSGVAYVVRDGKRYTPDGKLVVEYDGNDPKNFTKWEPYKPAQS